MRSFLLYVVLLSLAGCSKTEPDAQIHRTATNPAKTLKAEVILIHEDEGWFPLFDERFFLQITNLHDSISYRVDWELMRGQGEYEGGIMDMAWLSNHEVLIDRWLYDRRQPLIYDVTTVTFTDVPDTARVLSVFDEQ